MAGNSPRRVRLVCLWPRSHGMRISAVRHLSELNTPKSPYPDGDISILECPCCGSGEWLHNADESKANFCGQCGQAIDWTEPEVHCGDCAHLTFSDCYGECGKGYKGIVQPGDSCGKGEHK